MRTTRARHASSARRTLTLRSKVARYVAALVALPLVVTGLVTVAQPAGAAGVVADTRLAGSGFPQWYADSKGDRVEPCLDTDGNCILPAVGEEPNYNPNLPLSFPSNFPSEFFYAYAVSNTIPTPGCGSSPAGKASVVLALEGAFVNGDPAPGDQMAFGRIRVRVSSGLCPNTDYKFRHPFGVEDITTNDAGQVTATLGTEDIGCLPAPGVPCDFGLAVDSRVFGTAAGGFLRWDDPDSAPIQAGYLGDAVTPHTVTGGTAGNDFAILDAHGTQLLDDTDAPLSTNLFTTAGKLAGPLAAPDLDFGGVVTGTTDTRTVTVANIGTSPVTINAGATTVLGDPGSVFAVSGGTCLPTAPDAPVSLASDATCTLEVTYSPADTLPASDVVQLASTGGLRSPLSIRVSGTGINDGDAPKATASPDPLAFDKVRIRTEDTRTVTVLNDGLAPLRVSDIALTNGGTGSGSEQFHVLAETCTTGGRTVPVGESCSISVTMRPISRGVHNARLEISSNIDGGLTTVAISGEGTGGVAAVSDTVSDYDGFPDWYRDENKIKLSQCIDPKDPYCVVLPDGGYDPAADQEFPANFPGEFFYTVADSEPITTPGCDGGPEGSAFIRSAVEGTFVNGSAANNEQMVFGRVRIVVRGGLCADTAYTFVHPYGTTVLKTDDRGSIKPIAGTVDIGCAPIPPATCDFSLALTSPVFGGFLRWDPAVAPAAPPGYLGDAVNFHKVVGAPYEVEGAPANFFRILDGNGTTVGETELFSVMGKMRGPLEVVAGVNAAGTAELGSIAVASTSGDHEIQFRNTGMDPVTLPASAATLSGTDAADFSVSGDTCSATTLAVGDTCTVHVSFSPTAVGDRTADLTVVHDGINSPVVIPLHAVGGVVGTAAAISFQPRSVSFPQLKVGGTSGAATVTISNAGGNQDLTVLGVTIADAPTEFAVADNRCPAAVAPGETCQVDVVFTPTAAGTINGRLVVEDNAPGFFHSLPLTGVASGIGKAVDDTFDANGFPRFYQDANGVRLEPCIDTNGKCIVLGDATYNPVNPLSFPTNFPGEFFYAIADSDVVPLDGCGGTTEPGQALLRVALEGTFADGVPSFGDQMTFTRIRFTANRGLCPSTPYNWVTPYGSFQFTTNEVGGLPRNQGTVDIGCPAVAGTPCVFTDALDSPVPAGSPGVPADRAAADLPDTPIDGFLRWDPNVGTAAPAGYLGDATTPHKVVGGTYRPLGSRAPVNSFEIHDTADNLVASTDKFIVAGKVAGPLFTNVTSVAFGHVPSETVSGLKTVTVRNVSTAPQTVTTAKNGSAATEFAVTTDGTCDDGPVPVDGTCTIKVRFEPVGPSGPRQANLIVSAAGDPAGRTTSVVLSGIADPPLAPAITITPGVLSYGNVTAPGPKDLSVTVTNSGTAPLRVNGASISAGGSDYSVLDNGCVADVAPAGVDLDGNPTPAGTCTITVRFVPSTTAARVGTLHLTHNATGGATDIALTGNGVGSTFSVSPNPVGFSKVGVNTTKSSSLSIKNTGTIAFRMTGAVVNSATAGIFGTTNGTCINQVIQPGRSCSMTVTFRPTTAGQNYTGQLVLTGDSTSLPRTVSVAVSGQGK